MSAFQPKRNCSFRDSFNRTRLIFNFADEVKTTYNDFSVNSPNGFQWINFTQSSYLFYIQPVLFSCFVILEIFECVKITASIQQLINNFVRKLQFYDINFYQKMATTLANLDPDTDYAENKIDISFRNVTYQVEAKNEDGQKFTKTLLHGVSGIFKAGQLNVIMGASGAGKTTLLNILAGRISEFQGQILANGTPYNFQTFGDFANYVMQGDILMETLTVRETLQFAANLKLSDKSNAKERVQQIIKQLKLEKCVDVLVGGALLKGISGGEKKRTSLAVELISDPQVVALDEPTSGMDSLTSFIIINQLKNLCKKGKTIFLTIHQPNSQIYALFDNLFLMIEGKFIYQGEAKKSMAYFTDYFGLSCPQFQNPADFYLSIMHHQDKRNTERYQKYFETYEKMQSKQVLSRIEKGQKRAINVRLSQTNFLRNVKLLLRREISNIIRNPIVMQSRIIQIILMSIYTGGLYFSAGRKDYTQVIAWYAIIGYLFFISMDLFMQSTMPVVITFPLERLVFLKEQNSKMYTLGEYFLSRNAIEIPYIVIIPFIFMLINYWMIGLGNTPQQFFTMYLILFAMSFSGTSLGMLVGSLITDPKLVSGLIPIFFIPILAFSGFFKNYSNMPDWNGWIRFISPFNYSFTALVGNETIYKASRIGQINFDVSMWIAILIQFCLGIGFRILTYFFLMLKKDKLQ